MLDGEGSLWIGTEGEGICRMADGRFHILRRDDGLGHDWDKRNAAGQRRRCLGSEHSAA